MIQHARHNQSLVGHDLARADWHRRCGASPPQLSSHPLGGHKFQLCTLHMNDKFSLLVVLALFIFVATSCKHTVVSSDNRPPSSDSVSNDPSLADTSTLIPKRLGTRWTYLDSVFDISYWQGTSVSLTVATSQVSVDSAAWYDNMPLFALKGQAFATSPLGPCFVERNDSVFNARLNPNVYGSRILDLTFIIPPENGEKTSYSLWTAQQVKEPLTTPIGTFSGYNVYTGGVNDSIYVVPGVGIVKHTRDYFDMRYSRTITVSYLISYEVKN